MAQLGEEGERWGNNQEQNYKLVCCGRLSGAARVRLQPCRSALLLNPEHAPGFD